MNKKQEQEIEQELDKIAQRYSKCLIPESHFQGILYGKRKYTLLKDMPIRIVKTTKSVKEKEVCEKKYKKVTA